MGVNFVIMVENLAFRTQDEVNRKFGVKELCGEIYPEWLLFTYKGKRYAKWEFTPRFFVAEEEPEKWEALRKYLIRARDFFAGEVLLTNDVCWFGMPSEEDKEEPGYYLPGEIWEKYLEDPDYEEHPGLRNIKELEGLVW